jgi:hypothetical protein
MICGDWYERWMDGLVPSLTRTPRSPPAESNRLETKVCGGQPYGFTDTPAKALLRVARSRVVTVALIRRTATVRARGSKPYLALHVVAGESPPCRARLPGARSAPGCCRSDVGIHGVRMGKGTTSRTALELALVACLQGSP